jgi:hypothetical protein
MAEIKAHDRPPSSRPGCREGLDAAGHGLARHPAIAHVGDQARSCATSLPNLVHGMPLWRRNVSILLSNIKALSSGRLWRSPIKNVR